MSILESWVLEHPKGLMDTEMSHISHVRSTSNCSLSQEKQDNWKSSFGYKLQRFFLGGIRSPHVTSCKGLLFLSYPSSTYRTIEFPLCTDPWILCTKGQVKVILQLWRVQHLFRKEQGFQRRSLGRKSTLQESFSWARNQKKHKNLCPIYGWIWRQSTR